MRETARLLRLERVRAMQENAARRTLELEVRRSRQLRGAAAECAARSLAACEAKLDALTHADEHAFRLAAHAAQQQSSAAQYLHRNAELSEQRAVELRCLFLNGRTEREKLTTLREQLQASHELRQQKKQQAQADEAAMQRQARNGLEHA